MHAQLFRPGVAAAARDAQHQFECAAVTPGEQDQHDDAKHEVASADGAHEPRCGAVRRGKPYCALEMPGAIRAAMPIAKKRGRPARRGSIRSSDRDRIAQHADVLDLDFHDVAVGEKNRRIHREAHAVGSAGGDDVAGFERHSLG
jgi:hypothetical protein